MKVMKSLLNHFDPITLEQMSDIRLLNRTDTKFVTTRSRLEQLLMLAKDDYYVQEIDGERIAPYYTLYFDTEDHAMYTAHESGHTNRQKLRIRSYVNSGLNFLEQVEYAMEAVNQGNLLVGVKSNTHVVLIGFKSAPNEKLSYFPEKLFKVSNHIGIGIAGLTPDGRLIYQYMKNQCLNYNYTFNADYPIEKLVNKIAEKSQLKTQRGESKRPYGVGLLIAGFDRTGPRLFRTCPSANFYEYHCVAIGSRSQAATSFLENNMEKLPTMSKDDLIKIALEATKKAEDVKINGNNIDVILVGKDDTTKLLSIEEIDNYLKAIDNKMDLS